MEPITTVSDNVAAFAALSDDELVVRVKDLAACERRASVALIRSLVEFDARRLYLPRRLFLTLHLLHARAASVGRIGIQPYRNRTGGAALSESARGFRTRRPHADCRPPARAAFDAGKSRRGAGGRTAQEQAGDSGADCVIEPSSGGCDHHPAGGRNHRKVTQRRLLLPRRNLRHRRQRTQLSLRPLRRPGRMSMRRHRLSSAEPSSRHSRRNATSYR
jgi:hypothetical protein